MKNFQLLDELPSDAGFIAYGRTTEELFKNSGIALSYILYDFDDQKNKTDVNKKSIKKQIKLESENLEELLYDFLNSVLIEFELNNLVFRDFTIEIKDKKQKKSKENSKESLILKATLLGEKALKERIRNQIKAITLHDFKISKEDKIWQAKVFLDL